MEKIKRVETKPASKEKPKKRKGFIRENIESILIAVALALGMRFFIVEAFKIPTGSMAPTLLGAHKDIKCPNCNWRFYHNNNNGRSAFCPNCMYKIDTRNLRDHGGNRILVNKIFYKFTKPNPKRWEVIVFKYPRFDVTCKSCSYRRDDVEWSEGMKCPTCGSTRLRKKQKNYIKRLVGLPGETVQVINGDLYINNHIQRKPPEVQNALWVPVYNGNYSSKRKLFTDWAGENSRIENKSGELTIHPSASKANPNEEKLSFLSFGRPIMNHSGYNSGTGEDTVGDLMIRFDVQTTEDSGGITAVIEEDGEEYKAFIRSKGGKQESYLERSGAILKSDSGSYIEPGKKHKIEFSNVDDMLTLLLDGRVIFSYDYTKNEIPPIMRNHQGGIKIGCAGTSVTFSNIEIFADVYYTDSPHNWGVDNPSKLGKGEYFFLGDNSSSSNDSRVWKFVPEKNLVGRAFLSFWPPRTIKLIR